MLTLIVSLIAVASTLATSTAANVKDFTPGGLYIVHHAEAPPYNVTADKWELM